MGGVFRVEGGGELSAEGGVTLIIARVRPCVCKGRGRGVTPSLPVYARVDAGGAVVGATLSLPMCACVDARAEAGVTPSLPVCARVDAGGAVVGAVVGGVAAAEEGVGVHAGSGPMMRTHRHPPPPPQVRPPPPPATPPYAPHHT